MNAAIRYFSRFGHSAQMADVVGQVLQTKPETIDVPLDGVIDTLYLGAGVMLGTIDKSMVEFIKSLQPTQVRRVVCFGSCAIIKSPVPQMRKLLEANGITVDQRSFTCRGSMGPLHAGHPNGDDLSALRQFVEQTK